MCYLCLRDNPFSIVNHNRSSDKKTRAAEIKILLNNLNEHFVCETAAKEIDNLKQEQYELAKEI